MLYDPKQQADRKKCLSCGELRPATPEFFHRNPSGANRLDPRCKPCRNARQRDRYRTEPQRRRIQKDRTLRYLFGISLEEYEQKLAAQGGACAVCGEAESIKRNGMTLALAVDHDRHCCPGDSSCGKCVRGLLCNSCNRRVVPPAEGPLHAKAHEYLELYR